MEEGSDMMEGYDGGGGAGNDEEEERGREDDGALDQEMDECREKDLLSQGVAVSGYDKSISMEVHGGECEGAVQGGMIAAVEDGTPVLVRRGDEGGVIPEKIVLNWRKALVGSGKGGLNSEDGGKCDAEMGMEAEGDAPVKEGVLGGKEKVVEGRTRKNYRELVFDEHKEGFVAEDGVTVQVDKGAMADCETKLGNALVGRILGRPLPFGYLNRELRRRWGHFGKMHLSLVGRNCFVCFFSSVEVRDEVLSGGPWFIGNQLIGVDKWSVDFDPSSINGFSSPVWVRLPHLPLNLWSDSNLGRIVSMIGTPLWVDEVTASWGRTEFARVCVRVDFAKKLPTGVWIQGVEKRFFQPVVYEGIDQLCFHCGIIGHVAGECREKVRSGGDVGNVSGNKEGVMRGDKEVRGECSQAAANGERGSAERVEQQVGRQQPGVVGNEVAGAVAGGKGVQRKEGVSDCREDRGYGEWTLVQKRKPRMNFQHPGAGSGFNGGGGGSRQQVNKSGRVEDNFVRFKAMGNDVGGREGGGVKGGGEKPLLKYKRGGAVNSPSSFGGSVKVNRGREGVDKGKRPVFGGNYVDKGESNPVMRHRRVLVVGEGSRTLVEGPPSSPIDDGFQKRRRGGESEVCGGDASPLVIS